MGNQLELLTVDPVVTEYLRSGKGRGIPRALIRWAKLKEDSSRPQPQLLLRTTLRRIAERYPEVGNVGQSHLDNLSLTGDASWLP